LKFEIRILLPIRNFGLSSLVSRDFSTGHVRIGGVAHRLLGQIGINHIVT